VTKVNQSYYPELPEAQSIKSMYHVVRILAIIFGILLFLGGLAYTAVVWVAWNACNSAVGGLGATCSGSLAAFLIAPFFIIIFGVIDIIVYLKMKALEAMVNNRQYEAAKSATLIWMIIGFVLGGVIIGVLLLVAYLKFDPLIAAARNQAQMPPPSGGYSPQGAPMGYGAPPPGYGAPPPGYGAPPPGYSAPPPGYAAPPPAYLPPPAQAPPPPMPPAAPSAPICPRCGKPTTWVAQYNRYYCYTDSAYV
jgi:hypothetical protein